MFVYNDTLTIYGGYCRVPVAPKGGAPKKGKPTAATSARTVGLVHTDLWSLKLTPDFKNVKWERRKRAGFAPSARSGSPMVLHKNRAILFGGVQDEDVSEEQLCSNFFNDMCALYIHFYSGFECVLKRMFCCDFGCTLGVLMIVPLLLPLIVPLLVPLLVLLTIAFDIQLYAC